MQKLLSGAQNILFPLFSENKYWSYFSVIKNIDWELRLIESVILPTKNWHIFMHYMLYWKQVHNILWVTPENIYFFSWENF